MAKAPDQTARPIADRLLAELPPRVARIETHIEYMRGDIVELKAGQKELRGAMTGEFKSVRTEGLALRAGMHAEFKALLAHMRSNFRWLFSLLIASFAGPLGAMAHGFHWI